MGPTAAMTILPKGHTYQQAIAQATDEMLADLEKDQLIQEMGRAFREFKYPNTGVERWVQ